MIRCMHNYELLSTYHHISCCMRERIGVTFQGRGFEPRRGDRGLKNECCSPDSHTERSQSTGAYGKSVGKAEITFCGLKTKFA